MIKNMQRNDETKAIIDIFMQKVIAMHWKSSYNSPNFLKRIITMHEPTERATESQESVLSNPNNGLHLRPDDAPPSSDDNPHLQSTGTAPSSNGSPHLQPNSAAATSSSVYLQANGTLERSPETPTAVVSSRFRVPVFSDNPLTEPRIHVLSNVTTPRTSLLKTLKDIGSVFTLQISGEVAQNATTTISGLQPTQGIYQIVQLGHLMWEFINPKQHYWHIRLLLSSFFMFLLTRFMLLIYLYFAEENCATTPFPILPCKIYLTLDMAYQAAVVLAKGLSKGADVVEKYRVAGLPASPLAQTVVSLSPRGRLAKKFGTILEIYVPLELLQNTSTQITGQQLAPLFYQVPQFLTLVWGLRELKAAPMKLRSSLFVPMVYLMARSGILIYLYYNEKNCTDVDTQTICKSYHVVDAFYQGTILFAQLTAKAVKTHAEHQSGSVNFSRSTVSDSFPDDGSTRPPAPPPSAEQQPQSQHRLHFFPPPVVRRHTLQQVDRVLSTDNFIPPSPVAPEPPLRNSPLAAHEPFSAPVSLSPNTPSVSST